MIALCAVLSGGQGAVDMAEFAKAKEPFLREFLKLVNGLPSHDTFSRPFRQLDPAQFGAAFQRFMAGFCEQIEGVVAIDGNRGKTPGPPPPSGGLAATADEVCERPYRGSVGHPEPGAEILPEGDAELAACLAEAEECVSAIAAGVAAGAAADGTLGHLAADVVFRAVGVQRNVRMVEHHEQLGLVGVQPLEQAIQRRVGALDRPRTRWPQTQFAMRSPAGGGWNPGVRPPTSGSAPPRRWQPQSAGSRSRGLAAAVRSATCNAPLSFRPRSVVRSR